MRLVSSRRVALVLAVPVMLIAGAVFATAGVQRSAALLGARRQVASQDLLTAMLDQETGARGFFAISKPAFLQPWNQGTSAFGSSLAELRSLVAGNAGLEGMLADQAQRASAWHSATQAELVTLEQTGHSQSDAESLRDKRLMDGFRAAHTAFDASLEVQRDRSQSAATAVAVGVVVALATLLGGIGLVLTRRLVRREEARQRDQSEIRELLQASGSEHESRAVLIRHVERLLPGARTVVFNRNNSDDRLEITRGSSAAEPLLGDANTEHLHPRSCMAIRLSRSYDRHPGDEGLVRCEICGVLEGASACEPLLVGGQVIGSVLVASTTTINDERRTLVSESVAQAAPILANQRNLKLAESRAASDAITGLPNRRAADETLKRLAAHAGRRVSPLAAILLDLDHFKRLNDRHGHESGDKALALVGQIIGSTIRASDFGARFGGEEFLILLPDTDRDGAMLVAEKLRSEIEHAELVGIGPMSASLGLAVLPTDAAEADDLVRKADQALYAAKQDGRNRVHPFSRSAAEQENESATSPR